MSKLHRDFASLGFSVSKNTLHEYLGYLEDSCYANGGELDLCDEEGAAFWNTCWSLSDADTVQREERSLRLGRTRTARAKGILLYHEFASGLRRALSEAQPAWRWLLEQGRGTTRP